MKYMLQAGMICLFLIVGPVLPTLAQDEPLPDDPSLLWLLVDEHLAASAWSAAVEALAHLVEVAPEDAEAHYHLALLIASYDPDGARAHLNRAAALEPAYAGRAEMVGAALVALADETDRAYANARLAVVFLALEAWPAAEATLQRALLLNPRYAEAQAYLGLARVMQDKGGLALVQQAVEMAPESAQVRYLLGRVYLAYADDTAAIPVLIQAAALDPEAPMIAATLGAAYWRRGSHEEAARWLRRAADLDPQNPHHWEQLARFYAETLYKLEDEGLTAINTAVVWAPDNADIRASLGWALFHTGELEAGLVELAAALERQPEDARTLYYYGLLSELNGQVSQAAEAYLDVLNAPDNEDFAALAVRGLDRLRWDY